MTSNLALISDRHNIKSAPKERNSLRIPHVTVVLRLKFYSFLIIWVVLKFCGCTSSQLPKTVSYFLNPLFTVKSDASKQTFRTLWHMKSIFYDFFMVRFLHKVSFWTYFGKIWHMSWMSNICPPSSQKFAHSLPSPRKIPPQL